MSVIDDDFDLHMLTVGTDEAAADSMCGAAMFQLERSFRFDRGSTIVRIPQQVMTPLMAGKPHPPRYGSGSSLANKLEKLNEKGQGQ